jgi:hypothetical protein
MATRSNITHDDADATPAIGVRPVPSPNRLAMYAALGGTVGAMPLPWLPDSLIRRLRGALAHDIVCRHGVSLTREARAALAEPAGLDGPRSLAAQAVSFLGVRLAARALARIGPVAVVWAFRDAVRMYLLGHLLDRYLEIARAERAVRIDLDEARRIRRAIDGALLRALTAPGEPFVEPTVIDDQRDALTALVDGIIGLAAGLPDRLIQRLDAAFDLLVSQGDG